MFGMSLETRQTKLSCRDNPAFRRDIPEVPEKLEKKKVWVQFSLPSYGLSFIKAGKNNKLNFLWPKTSGLGPRF